MNPFNLLNHTIGGDATTGATDAQFQTFYGTSTADRIKKKWVPQIVRLGMDQLVWQRFLTMENWFGMNEGQTVSVPVNYWDRGIEGLGALQSFHYGKGFTQGTDGAYTGTEGADRSYREFVGLPRNKSITYGTRRQDHFEVTLHEYGRAYDHKKFDDNFLSMSQMPQMFVELAFNAAYAIDAQAYQIFKDSYTVARTTGTATAPKLGFRTGAGYGPASLKERTGGTGANKNAGKAFVAGSGLMTSFNVLDLETMMREALVPTFGGNTYIMVGASGFFNGLRKDTHWIDVQLYANAGMMIINHEIGMIHGVRCIETNEHTQAGVGYIFGPNVGVVSWALPLDILIEEDLQQDFGRRSGAAWYAGNGVAPALRDYYYDGRQSTVTEANRFDLGQLETKTGKAWNDITGHCIKIFTGALPADA